MFQTNRMPGGIRSVRRCLRFIAGQRQFDLLAIIQDRLRSSHGSQRGLGIGLTLVKRLASMHGGGVEIHSAGTGKGGESVLRLPLSNQAVSVEA